MENLSLTDKEKRKEDIKFNLKEYTIKTKTCEEHTIFLPFPGELKELISLNTISNRISLDSNKLVSFFGTNNDIDFLNNDFIHSSIILKAICAFLGSINQENDIADITDDYVSPLEDEQYLENSKNYFSYIEKNKNIITKIETITKKYTLADFVKTDEWFKDFIEQTKKLEARNVYRHLYSERQDCLIKEDSVTKFKYV